MFNDLPLRECAKKTRISISLKKIVLFSPFQHPKIAKITFTTSFLNDQAILLDYNTLKEEIWK